MHFAHTDPQSGSTHLLEDHLRQVEKRAALAAGWPGGGAWAGLAGLWHDLGKYAVEFQTMLRNADGGEAHVESAPGRVNHSSAGALWAIERFRAAGRPIAYIIAGHHAGLPDWSPADGGASSLQHRLTESRHLERARAGAPPADILQRDPPRDRLADGMDPAFWIRMLFSAVVDSDFLDTEAFFTPVRVEARAGFPSIDELKVRLDAFLEQRFQGAPGTPVNIARGEVLAACRAASEQAAGLFSLTVPTGGGKTLSSLAFALAHARRHGLRRVIYVIPYTSIIEQTADVFRDAVGGEAVVEHHSNLEPTPEKETARTRLACENWDAPLIVTTSVQFFESLFAARPSGCRKLHNIARSVVILDEAQLLPPRFLRPILHALRELLNHYGTTVVLCTATQPALHAVFRGFKPREIIAEPARLYRMLNRVAVSVPSDLAAPVAWPDLAEELKRRSSVLCIVNRRDDCRRLHALMPEGTIHLSTFMCGAHRANVIAEIKRRLAVRESVRVVSTQLVEAGVDIDFPSVFRALAGLDSLAQAAGRCNREGRLPELGEFVVFVPASKPPGDIAQAAEIARRIIARDPHIAFAPESFERFFFEFYWLRGEAGLDARGVLSLLGVRYITDREQPTFYSPLEYAFRKVAGEFRLIDDVQAPIIVAYGEGTALIEDLQIRQPSRDTFRRLQRHMVPVPRRLFEHLLQAGRVAEAPMAPGLHVQRDAQMYRGDIGIVFDSDVLYEPGSLIA
jgi:CRISPR-associated endonuclease/helicase Cas3